MKQKKDETKGLTIQEQEEADYILKTIMSEFLDSSDSSDSSSYTDSWYTDLLKFFF